ncbi:MAG: DNA-protecting protein DprA [Rubellimicrobium sp.]|nr:DNA-protecting protein DprA [Rubellimicrobium sp.]
MTVTAVSSTHPPLPPTEEEERLARLRLLRSRRVGNVTWWRLMREHGSGKAALDALPGVARSAGIDDYTPCPEGVVRAELAAGHRAGARLVLHGDAAYPSDLGLLADAPPALWVKGNPALLQRQMVAVAGARNASSLGLRMARLLAGELGRTGLVVVSGLARGIDAAAHEAAIDTGTVAVMAGGIDVIYPQEHAGLAARIAETGLLLSEQPVGVAPVARHFPARNRVIAGLSRAVVVVEAALRSGSLITARDALDLGREVMAVPGHPLDARAGGCNALLRDGATLVRGAQDVLAVIAADAAPAAPADAAPATVHADPAPAAPAPGFQERAAQGLARVAALHRQILARLGPVPVAADHVIRDIGAPAPLVSSALAELELDGHIHRTPGGGLALAS